MFTVLLAGRFSSSCGASMATLLEKRQSIALLFAADQKDQFFSTSSVHFAGYHWFRCLHVPSLPSRSPCWKTMGRSLGFENPVLFFSRNFTSQFVVVNLPTATPGIHPMDSPPPTLQFGHGTIDPFACVVIRATWWSFFGGSFWRFREIKQTT